MRWSATWTMAIRRREVGCYICSRHEGHERGLGPHSGALGHMVMAKLSGDPRLGVGLIGGAYMPVRRGERL